MLQLWPSDPSNDPANDGSALVGVFYVVLIELGVALVVLLLYWLF